MKSMRIGRAKSSRPRVWLLTATLLASALATGSVLATEAASPSTGGPGAASADERAEAAPEAVHHGSVFVDPLGLVLFGPTFGMEAGAGRISGTLYGRWLNAGVLAHSLFLKDKESFAFSYGAGLRGRYFFRDDLSGPHLGIGAEFVQSRVDDSVDLVETKSTYVVPLVEGGYRLPFSGVYLGAAASLGYAFQASSSVGNLPGGNSAGAFSATDKSTIYGSASLEMGVYF
ncbi:MAG: hypothetical protein ABJB12_02050 [Pseudomonadota bacterium]